MHPAFSVICPTCKANISDTDRACGQCGADVSVWPGVGRTPLILPGNPALSEDEVRRRVSPLRIVTGTVVGAAALIGALFLTSANESDEPALLYAVGTTTPGAALADNAPASPVTLPPAASAPSPSPQRSADSTLEARASAPTTIDVPAEPALEPIPSFVESPTDLVTIVPPVKATVTTPPRSAKPASAAPTPTRIAVRAPANAPSPTIVPPTRPAPAASAPPRAMVAATGAVAAVRSTPVAAPVLRLTPLVSDSLRPGELLQLRWSVLDRATARPVKADIEFTSTDASVASVDRRTGMVTARKPGRVRIIVDAGAGGGETAVALTVRPQATVAVSLAPPAEALQARTDAARSTSVIAAPPSPTPTVAPPASPPVTPTPATTSAATPARDVRRDETPSDTDIRTVVDRVIADVRRSGARNAQIMEFLADGDGHRVAMIGTASSSSAGNNALRVSFELRLTKFDGGGRPVARIVPVSLTLDKRDNAVTSSAVSVGALRRP